MQEILTLEQFREVKARGTGFIAITDYNLTRNCVHHVKCGFVNEENFSRKVIESDGKNGEYHFTDDPQEALNQFKKMDKCGTCFRKA